MILTILVFKYITKIILNTNYEYCIFHYFGVIDEVRIISVVATYMPSKHVPRVRFPDDAFFFFTYCIWPNITKSTCRQKKQGKKVRK